MNQPRKPSMAPAADLKIDSKGSVIPAEDLKINSAVIGSAAEVQLQIIPLLAPLVVSDSELKGLNKLISIIKHLGKTGAFKSAYDRRFLQRYKVKLGQITVTAKVTNVISQIDQILRDARVLESDDEIVKKASMRLREKAKHLLKDKFQVILVPKYKQKKEKKEEIEKEEAELMDKYKDAERILTHIYEEGYFNSLEDVKLLERYTTQFIPMTHLPSMSVLGIKELVNEVDYVDYNDTGKKIYYVKAIIDPATHAAMKSQYEVMRGKGDQKNIELFLSAPIGFRGIYKTHKELEDAQTQEVLGKEKYVFLCAAARDDKEFAAVKKTKVIPQKDILYCFPDTPSTQLYNAILLSGSIQQFLTSFDIIFFISFLPNFPSKHYPDIEKTLAATGFEDKKILDLLASIDAYKVDNLNQDNEHAELTRFLAFCSEKFILLKQAIDQHLSTNSVPDDRKNKLLTLLQKIESVEKSIQNRLKFFKEDDEDLDISPFRIVEQKTLSRFSPTVPAVDLKLDRKSAVVDLKPALEIKKASPELKNKAKDLLEQKFKGILVPKYASWKEDKKVLSPNDAELSSKYEQAAKILEHIIEVGYFKSLDDAKLLERYKTQFIAPPGRTSGSVQWINDLITEVAYDPTSSNVSDVKVTAVAVPANAIDSKSANPSADARDVKSNNGKSIPGSAANVAADVSMLDVKVANNPKQFYYTELQVSDVVAKKLNDDYAATMSRDDQNIELVFPQIEHMTGLGLFNVKSAQEFFASRSFRYDKRKVYVELLLDPKLVSTTKDGVLTIETAKLSQADISRCISDESKIKFYTSLEAAGSLQDLKHALASELPSNDNFNIFSESAGKIIDEIKGIFKDESQDEKSITEKENEEKMKAMLVSFYEKLTQFKAEITKQIASKKLYPSARSALKKLPIFFESIEKTIQKRLGLFKLIDTGFFKLTSPLVMPNDVPPLDLKTDLVTIRTHKAAGLISDEKIDLRKFPNCLNLVWASTDAIEIGDAHGHVIKLIYYLLRENIIQGINESDYAALLKIYKKKPDSLVKDDVVEFDAIIAKITSAHGAASPLIKFIGDLLADRGSNDYFTLCFLHQLKALKIPYEINVSNHDREFIRCYEGNKIENVDGDYSLYPVGINVGQAKSLVGLGHLLNRKIVSSDVVMPMIESSYLPALRAVGLSLDEERKEINYSDHAEVAFNDSLMRLSKDFSLPISVDTFKQVSAIKEVVLNVNKKTCELVAQRRFYEASESEDSALYGIMWDRSSDRSKDIIPDGWTINYIHGHTGHGVSTQLADPRKRVINLDNILGHGESEKYEVGTYTYYYAGNNPRFLQLRSEAILASENKKQLDMKDSKSTEINPSNKQEAAPSVSGVSIFAPTAAGAPSTASAPVAGKQATQNAEPIKKQH